MRFAPLMPIPREDLPLPASCWLDSTVLPARVGRPLLLGSLLGPKGKARLAGDENGAMFVLILTLQERINLQSMSANAVVLFLNTSSHCEVSQCKATSPSLALTR